MGVKYEEIMHRNLWNLIFILYEFIQEDLLRAVHFQSKLLYLSLSEAETRQARIQDFDMGGEFLQ